MAAMFATSSCDDRPDNGWVAPKTPRPRTGLGSGDGAEKLGLGVGLADIFTTDLRWRCGSVGGSMQRDPTCPSTAPISTAEGLRPTRRSLDSSPLVTHHPWTAHARGEYAHLPPPAPVSAIAIELVNSLLQWSRLYEQSRPRKEGRWDTDLLEAAENPPVGDIEPPPSYDDSARDILPPYTLHNTSVQLQPPPESRLGGIDPSQRTALPLTHHMTAPKPDLGATSNFRQVGGKKKKNQKKGDQDNWGGSGDEEGKKDGGTHEKNNGDDAGDGGVGGGGAGAGGGGDDGDGGAGDGGGDDDWNSGKKKKKGKKGKAAVDEEEEKKAEEERKMKEQEEEDERKRKEEEEAVNAGGPPSWPDGGDADPDADWGFTKAEKKVKKGKKGKAEEEEKRRKEEEEEEKKRKEDEEAAEAAKAADSLSWADVGQADTSAGWEGFTATEKKGKKGKKGNEEGDEKKKTEGQAAMVADPLSWADGGHADTDTPWATFGTTDKKGKKAKKAKFEPLPDPTPDSNAAGSAPFDNVDLGDTPQIDINFGGGALNKMEPKMDFLDFGTSWNTPNILDTYGADAATADITDTINSTAMDGGKAWGFSDSKKKKKQTTTAGFGFGNFDTQETLEQQPRLDDAKEGGNGIGGGAVVPAGKKDKKGKKKGGADDFSPEPAAIVPDAAVTDPLNNAEDTFASFTAASSKKDKKKGKKGGLDASIGELPAISEPPPPTEHPVDEEWASFGITKDKKKGKKGAIPEPDKKEEPIVNLGEEPETDLGFGWGFSKKDKKKGKNVVEEDSSLPEEPLVLAAPVPVPEDEPDKESNWGFGSKKSKKSKKGAEEEPTPSEERGPPITSEPPLEEVGGWDFGSKKDKKKGKKIAPEEYEPKEPKEPLVPDFPEPEPLVESTWSALGTKKDKKKGKKDTFGEFTPAEDLNIVEAPEPPPIVEEPFPSFGKKKDRKNKKGLSEVKEDPIAVVDSTAAAAATTFVADTNWMDWGATDKKKDKKGKKGSEINEAEEAPGPPPAPPEIPVVPEVPEAPEVPEPYSFGGWGGSKKDRKGKNTKNIVPEPPLISVPDPVRNFLADENEGDWGGSWGFTGRDKKKKEEQEQEQEQREKEEREEQERLETEKEKEKQLAEKEKEKEKSKPGKKGRTTSTAAASKSKDAAVEPNADAVLSTEGDSWGTWASSKAKDKKKGGRKDAVLDPPPPAPTPPAQGLTPEPTPEPFAGVVPEFDDYNDNNWGSVAPAKAKGKKDVKKSAKAGEFKADSTAPKNEVKDSAFDFLQDNDQDEWGKDLLEEETPAKAAKSFWGGLVPGSTTKSKPSKEKDKGAAEAKKAEGPAQDLIDLDLLGGGDSLMDIIDEPVSKGFKSKAGSKVSNVAPKESDKSSKLGDKKKKGGWNVADSWGAAVAVTTAAAEVAADTKAADDDKFGTGSTNTNAKGDGWGFWGATKKTSGNSSLGGKLADEPKKEISKYGLTNQNDSLDTHPFSFSKEPEPSWFDDQAEPPKSTKPTKPPMSSTKPVAKLSSVAARVKALEKEKEKDKGKTLEPAPSPPVRDFEPLTDAQPPPKKSGVTAKSKAATASKSASWEKKDSLPLAAEKSKATAEFVPGSFPAEGADDEIVDVITTPAVKKLNKKKTKPKQAPAMNPIDLMDLEDVPEFDNSPDPGVSASSRPVPPPPAPEAPPTPPPEPAASKPAKKERARVVRDEGASSWGFWGASPKKAVRKEVKAKDDADIPSPFSKEKEKPGLARSKTTKAGKEKETEKSSGKSSGSDKEKKPESRPSKARGSSFGGFFGGPPPARPKPVRRPSAATPKNASRRQSMDIDALGLPSPPVHDAPEISSKAAKVMGTSSAKAGRKESVRGKPKVSAIPDPYPIDDDDMVMVNGLEDPIINAPIPKMPGRKDKSSKTRAGKEVQFTPLANDVHTVSRRPERNLQTKLLPDNADGGFDLKQAKQAPDVVDDVVMVEAGPSNDGMGSPVAQEDLAFTVERPKPLQRASTSAKKPGNSKLMGLFGGFQKSRRMSETYERTRGKNLGDNDERHPARKRTATGEDDGAKRIRRDDRRIRRAERPDVTVNGLIIDPPERDEGARLEPGNSESKREERRATRASREVSSNEIKDPDVSGGQDRRARRRESERPRDDGQAKVREPRDKKARKEEDQDALRHEEKRAKRAAKEDYAPEDLGFDIPEKKSKHREREPPEASTRNAAESSSRPHRSDHRRSRADQPLSPSGEPERRPHRSRRATGERSSHRKSVAPVEDYFDSRNGPPPPEPLQPDLPPLTQESHEPYMHGANDQTSSWVKSQISEPAPPPPLEPSVLDPTPVLGPVDDDEAEQEARRAARRKERRRSKYGEAAAEDDADRRRRRRSGREGVKSSEGSGDGDRPDRERRRSEYIGREGRGLNGFGTGPGLGLGTGTGTGMGMGMGMGGGGKRGSWFKKIGLQI